MKAALLQEHGVQRPYVQSRPLQVVDVDLASPGPGEVLVEIKVAGLCHSDLSTINGDRVRPVPMVLGHEASAIVRELGDGVSDIVVGQHVVLVFVPSCGHCAPCLTGRPALCGPGASANGEGTLLSGAHRLSMQGSAISHHLGVSAFAEFAVVSRRSLVPVPQDLPLDVAALFGCAVLTGVGAVVNTAAIQPGSSVAIVGLGGVGYSALLGALAAGASQIIVVDLLTPKLQFALTLGASAAFLANDATAVEQILELTAGGVDAAFEMAGVPAALEMAYRITKRGGTTVTAGLPHAHRRWAMPITQLVADERTIKGSYIGSCVPARDVPRFIDMYRHGRLPVDRLMGEHLALEDINRGFDQLADGATLRQLVVL